MPDFSSLFSLPGSLTGRALNNWLRTDGAGIFSAFENGAEALEFMRDLGANVATSTFYRIRSEVLNVVASSQPLLDYPSDQLIPLAWHVSDHGLDLSSDYQYRIHLYGSDSTTGLLKDQWMTVASDRQLTIDQVKDAARQYAGEGEVSGEIDDYVFGEIQSMLR